MKELKPYVVVCVYNNNNNLKNPHPSDEAEAGESLQSLGQAGLYSGY